VRFGKSKGRRRSSGAPKSARRPCHDPRQETGVGPVSRDRDNVRRCYAPSNVSGWRVRARVRVPLPPAADVLSFTPPTRLG
jgi:hypothetical protein